MHYNNTGLVECQDIIQHRIAKTLARAEEAKMNNAKTIAYMKRMGLTARAQRMEQCGEYIEMTGDKVTAANFCRDKFCAVCNWRRHLKLTSQAREVIANMSTEGYAWITLTVKSIKGQQLAKEVTQVLAAFNRLTRQPAWGRAFKGYMRALEITYNTKKGTYHPHIHVIVAVQDGYYKSGSYISQKGLQSMWEKAARLKYKPVVDIRAVENTSCAALEVSKYAVKMTDWAYSITVLRTMIEALAGRRLVGYGGAWRKLRQLLRQPDIEDEETPLEDGIVINDNVTKTIYKYLPTDGGIYKYKPYDIKTRRPIEDE